MLNVRSYALVAVVVLTPSLCFPQGKPETAEQVVKDQLKPLSDDAAKLFAENASLANSAAAALLLKETIGGIPGLDLLDENFHCIIHVTRWNFTSQPTKTARLLTQNLQNQHWYVFQGGSGNFMSGEEFSARRRIWGSKRVWLMYVHLNSRLHDRYTPAYVVTLTKKNPANIDALLSILKVFGIQEADARAKREGVSFNYWGAAPIEMKGWTTSDVSVLPAVSVKQIVLNADNEELTVDPPVVSQVKLGEAVTFDNEGRHRWDAGVGIPVRRASDLEFDSGVAAPATVNKASALAMISVYPYPIDIKSGASLIVPHLVFGVDISEKPLNEIFVGGGWGPVFANFYAGGSYVKLQEPNGDGDDREWRFAFGVLLKARGIVDKLK